jgi:hypothetical protein
LPPCPASACATLLRFESGTKRAGAQTRRITTSAILADSIVVAAAVWATTMRSRSLASARDELAVPEPLRKDAGGQNVEGAPDHVLGLS